MNGPWVAIQRNPMSGSRPRRAELHELIAELRRHGIRPRLFSHRERLARCLADPERRGRLVCLVAAGGDGTLGDIVNRFPDVPVALLPLGSENLFARHLGIARSGTAVAEMIAAGRTRRFDLGLLGERRFTLMASAGFDAAVVHEADTGRSGHTSKFRYVGPMRRALRAYAYPEFRVYVDDAAEPILTRLAVVVNVPGYAMRLKFAASARGDDELFDLRLFARGSAFQTARYFYHVWRGTHERLPDVTSLPVRRVRIESDEPVPMQADGDPAGWTPREIRVLPGALEVFVPARASESHDGPSRSA